MRRRVLVGSPGRLVLKRNCWCALLTPFLGPSGDTNSGAFGGHLWAFLGHIVELEGPRGLFDTGKSSSMWSVATISLRLAGLNWF